MASGKIIVLSCLLLFSVILLPGCRGSSNDAPNPPTSCDSTSPGPSLAEDLRSSLPPPDPLDRDVQWADIARQVPGGWAGIFLDGNGTLTMYLVDPSKEDEAKAALFALGVGLPRDVRQARVIKGRWDFAQLFDWYRYIQPHIDFSNGISFTDIDEAQNRLHYGMVSAASKTTLETSMQSLNLPCELVIIDVTGSVIPL
jgi:hypothetical protein